MKLVVLLRWWLLCLCVGVFLQQCAGSSRFSLTRHLSASDELSHRPQQSSAVSLSTLTKPSRPLFSWGSVKNSKKRSRGEKRKRKRRRRKNRRNKNKRRKNLKTTTEIEVASLDSTTTVSTISLSTSTIKNDVPSSSYADELVNFSELDLSCLAQHNALGKFNEAPKISRGYVIKYSTQALPDPPYKTYLEARYSCSPGYELEHNNNNKMYCHSGTWIGSLPKCVLKATFQAQHRKSCESDKGGCEHLCFYNENDIDVHCTCYRGYKISADGKSCEDINECAEGQSGCERMCVNRPGSHMCYCPKGFRLASDRKRCIDKNECLLRNGHGPCQDSCKNTQGGYACSCEGIVGTRLAANNHSCEDINECDDNNFGCSHTCLNTIGTAFCSCPSGFMLGEDWKTCQDINECEIPDLIKSCAHGCINTVGSYKCARPGEPHVPIIKCEEGLQANGDGECLDVNECLEDNFGCSDTCINTLGSAICTCPDGMSLENDKKTCKQVPVCGPHEGICDHMCIEESGIAHCICYPGYTLADDLKSCVDIDECLSHDCGDSTCTNLQGSFICD